jgi:hypothetical protein
MTKKKSAKRHDDAADYAQREYGVTTEELDRFVKRMNERIARDRPAGRMKPFSGDIEKDIAN